LLSCAYKRCDPTLAVKIMIPEEVLEHIDFKAGSYWIYKDSVSGDVDSMVVEENRHIFEEEIHGIDRCGNEVVLKQLENIVMDIPIYDTSVTFGSGYRENSFRNRGKMDGTMPLDEFILDCQGSCIFGYPLNRTLTMQDSKTVVDRIDSAVVGGIVYRNVIRVRETTNFSIFNESLWVKNIGKVQSTQELQSHIISRYNLRRYKVTR